MGISDRLLMGPGPSNSYPEVTMALAGPVLGHLDPQFLAILDSTNERLRQVFGTANALTLPLSGTGSAGMEAAFVNFVRPGDPVVVGVNGVFGERMCEVADRHGAEVVRVDAEWGEPIDPERLLSAHPAPSMVAIVHAETSTGVWNDIAPLGQGKGDALLLVDMVTSLGGMEVAVDEWSVDIAYSGTQKCLGVPPGLSPFTASARALERIVERPSSWYLDLNLLARYVNDSSGGARVYHHTAPVVMVAALGFGSLVPAGTKPTVMKTSAPRRNVGLLRPIRRDIRYEAANVLTSGITASTVHRPRRACTQMAKEIAPMSVRPIAAPRVALANRADTGWGWPGQCAIKEMRRAKPA